VTPAGATLLFVEENWARKVETLQMGVAIVTAWAEHDEPNIDLIDDLVRTYASETSANRVIEGLITVAGLLLVELRKAKPKYTEQELLQRLSAFYAAQEGDEPS
jgi:hypothetical protein